MDQATGSGALRALWCRAPTGRPARLTCAELRALLRQLKQGALAAGFPTEHWTMYDLTVFQAPFGKVTAKCYTQSDHVLRIEINVHNAKALRRGKLLLKVAEIVARLKAILKRFLNVVRSIDVACINPARLDELSALSQVGQTPVGGVDLTKPRARAVIGAVIGLAATPPGFSVSDQATQVQQITGVTDLTARPARLPTT